MPRYRANRPSSKHLGGRPPSNYDHTVFYPWIGSPEGVVDVLLNLPDWHATHDQGITGSCTGHAAVMERAIANEMDRGPDESVIDPLALRYDPLSPWRQAKAIDETTPITDPANDDDGTTIMALYQSIKDNGLIPVSSMVLSGDDKPVAVGSGPVDQAAGVSAFRWATSVDGVKAALQQMKPIVLSCKWYTVFSTPTGWYGDMWIPEPAGSLRGWHAVCLMGASDEKGGVAFKNSWRGWPDVWSSPAWMTYATLANLLADGGEAVIATNS